MTTRIINLLKYFLSIFFSFVLPIKNKRIVLWSTEGNNYSCNPRAMAEYLQAHPELGFDVYFAFKKGRVSKECKLRSLIIGSLDYLIKINTSEFLFTNHRTTSPRSFFWRKRMKQKYIMSWHGSMPLKMIEKDTINTLGVKYEKVAKKDSIRCNLMLSDNEWFSETIRRAFWYDGPIFETGIPRNDVFYNVEKRNAAIAKVYTNYNISSECSIVLYAPTFRTNHSLDAYVKDWDDCLEAFEKMLGKEIVLLTRLHPGMIGDKTFVIKSNQFRIIDATLYDEMQELLVTADILVTDFSSTMFEFSLLKKPCFLVASDLYSYDRNLYFPLDKLPYKKYSDIYELAKELPKISINEYIKEQSSFVNKVFSPIYDPNTSEKLTNWLLINSNK